jgi:hypothetical protein
VLRESPGGNVFSFCRSELCHHSIPAGIFGCHSGTVVFPSALFADSALDSRPRFARLFFVLAQRSASVSQVPIFCCSLSHRAAGRPPRVEFFPSLCFAQKHALGPPSVCSISSVLRSGFVSGIRLRDSVRLGSPRAQGFTILQVVCS